MQKPAIPRGDDARVNALHALGVLDSPPEERFDRITRLAKRVFDVPVAIVSLVDKRRQWFKSCNGLDVEETSRDVSFCAHAILGDDVLVVPDATTDLRFADNPLVRGHPEIRFYAGCPIKHPDGSRIGTICIIDTKPRDFGDQDREALRDLGSTVELELSSIELATTDELTNLLNRRGFSLLARHDLDVCMRNQNPASIVYFDLNNFKPVNDRFGHEEGDKVIKKFAQALKASFRQSDLVARLGGDEFAVMLSDVTLPRAKKMVERLATLWSSCVDDNLGLHEVTFSYGISVFEAETPSSLDDLLAEADILMYEDKSNRKATKQYSSLAV